jgi:hypothetical protein
MEKKEARENNLIKKGYTKAIFNDLFFEYCEKPEEMKSLIEERAISLFFKVDNVISNKWKDGLKSLKIDIQIDVMNEGIGFDFFESHVNTEKYEKRYKYPAEWQKVIDNIAYNVFADMSNYAYQPKDFDDFCSEYGYNNDSIKDKELFEEYIEHSELLHLSFRDSDFELFPR